MKTNEGGLKLIKSYEGCRLKAYKLAGEQYWTIGWGHSFDASITGETVWTQSKADCQFLIDLAPRESVVTMIACKKFPKLNSNQFSALVSYTYNRGTSGLKQLISNSHSIDEVASNMVLFWGSATRYKDALIKRRKAEQALFCSKC